MAYDASSQNLPEGMVASRTNTRVGSTSLDAYKLTKWSVSDSLIDSTPPGECEKMQLLWQQLVLSVLGISEVRSQD